MFGEGYSGLEYDYRGLLKLYRSTDNLAMADHYHDILHQWNTIRDLNNAAEVKPLEFSISVDFEETVKKYFSWFSKLPECFISPRVCVQWCGRKINWHRLISFYCEISSYSVETKSQMDIVCNYFSLYSILLSSIPRLITIQ